MNQTSERPRLAMILTGDDVVAVFGIGDEAALFLDIDAVSVVDNTTVNVLGVGAFNCRLHEVASFKNYGPPAPGQPDMIVKCQYAIIVEIPLGRELYGRPWPVGKHRKPSPGEPRRIRDIGKGIIDKVEAAVRGLAT